MQSRQRNCTHFLSGKDADLKAIATDIKIALDELLLSRPVTQSDIVQAYRRMAKRFHPDKATDADEKAWAAKKFVQVQTAYRLLKELPIEAINAEVTATGSRTQSQEAAHTAERRENVQARQPYTHSADGDEDNEKAKSGDREETATRSHPRRTVVSFRAPDEVACNTVERAFPLIGWVVFVVVFLFLLILIGSYGGQS